MSLTSATRQSMFTLKFNGQPLATNDSWGFLARAAEQLGLATFAFNTLFVPFPGVTIQCNY